MNPKTLSTLSQLNDLRHAAFEAMERKHKYPALLLFYSFIDICAALADEAQTKDNRARFKGFLQKYALLSWKSFRPYELWAARSSLLHAYSPFGNHTAKVDGAKPMFYYAYPETEAEMRAALDEKGHTGYILIDISTVKHIAVSCFNAMWSRVESEAAFEQSFLTNAEHLLQDLFQIRLEKELTLMSELIALREEQALK